MRLVLKERWNGFRAGQVKEVSDGVANLLIKRGFAERIDGEPRKETATQRQYAAAGARSKAAR